ncbi:hypothetical protein OJ997_27265 [Solirubrobacter phytolaccae]|uniref:Uncharacterized protein n=1 Tax=Solirubrobacter phytolaccae TaxID=1404360 RepID=A0A9X3SAT4_9ACTN|nr:hypothetical protein [Solirubrobacter phytolaccae]MDA0184038.1 hypothetical protein [Solirubrobacter phytolaccae]
MSEVPELRLLVRDVAERRSHRRRRRVLLRITAPAAALAAAALLIAGRPEGRDERPAVTTPVPTATAEPNPFSPVMRDPNTPPASMAEARALAEAKLGALRRPARPSDRFEQDAPRSPGSKIVLVEPDWSRARRVARLGALEHFVMPALWDGKTGFCDAIKSPRGSGTSSCTAGLPTYAWPFWSRTTERDGPIYFVLFPDGIDRVTLVLKTGKTSELRVVDNAVLFQQRGLQEIVWRDPTGREHRKRLVV